jgi:hypothetical protein
MPKSLTERVDDLLARSDPLERLAFLIDVRERTPQLRADALGEALALGLTRYRVAKELGVSTQAVQAWEATPKRKRKRP